jgi:hypothetical protein
MSLPTHAPSAKPAPPWVWLGVFSIGLATVAKLCLIAAGPDLEIDGYGHALAARKLIEHPTDLGVHWVWLPLGHVLYALLLCLGWGMDGIRYLNCALTSVLALGVACVVDRGSFRFSAPALRWTTAALVALSPLALATGESGVLEPLFALLVIASALSLSRRQGALAGLLASLAVLLRYEGWLLPPVFLWIWWRSQRDRSLLWAWLAPLSTIAAYVGLRAFTTKGGALSFLGENHAFASSFFTGVAAHWPVPPHAAWMSLWYAVIVPALVLGPLMPFAIAGIPWLKPSAPRPLVSVLLAILAFLTLGFVARQHLGLSRHALTLTPLYALLAAAGLLGAASFLHRRLEVRRLDAERWSFAFATVMTLLFAATRTLPTFLERAKLHASEYRDELAIASALQSAWSERARVYCDVTAVETLSDLPPRSFMRWKLRDTPRANLELEHAAGRDVLVVGGETAPEHLRASLRRLRAAGSLVLYRYVSSEDPVAEHGSPSGS